MSNATALKCRECGRLYPLDARFSCEFCFGPLEATYDYGTIARTLTRETIERGPASIWRYNALLPADFESRIDIGAGFTPLVRARNLGEALGLDNLYIKNDTLNPTWSFKDRVVSVALSRARELGFDTVACASTGNLANAVAGHAASAGLRAIVFIPHDLEPGKIVGSAVYGPTLVAVEGSYDDVNRLCTEVADAYPWGFANINLRPYYSEGSKTLGYEVAEQLGWRAPDHVVVPMASGSLFTKIWKGFNELADIGLIEKPQTVMSGAQAEGCAPIATAWEEGTLNFRPVKPKTIAKSLAIGNPADGYYALKILQETGGATATASDDEIIDGIKLLAETEGVFAETAGGVVAAGLKKLAEAGRINRKATTVAYITGGGLKTVEAVAPALAPRVTIAPRLDDFEAALGLRQKEVVPA
ncbi:MAG: threonine synthase [Dehalococcoidia bacterium]|nr:threonine synthase [Dehalococcoidia bacterium]